MGIENIFKPTIGNECLHQEINDNGVRTVNFATSRNLVVNSRMFPHRNIRKNTWTSPDGKSHNQIDHILIDRRWHSSTLEVKSVWGADCDTDHYLVVIKFRERLAVSKQPAQKFNVERFNLRMLNGFQVKKQYHIKISNKFRALEKLKDSKDTYRASENIKENIKSSAGESLGLYDLKQH